MTSEKALKWHRMNYQGFIETMWDGHEDNPFMDAFEMSIQALEKQIPKKPIPVETSDNEFICYVCPFCKNVEVKNFGVEYTDCCGQALDWGEE